MLILSFVGQRALCFMRIAEGNVKPEFSVLPCVFSSFYLPKIGIQRWKSKRTNKTAVNDSDSDSDSDNEEIKGKGTETRSSVVGTMRADLLLKVGLGVPRNKVEEAFYNGRIRINSLKILKKSAQVKVGDELDLIRSLSPNNPRFLIVGRVEVLDAKPRYNEEGIEVRLRRSKNLIVENYPTGDPWKESILPSREHCLKPL